MTTTRMSHYDQAMLRVMNDRRGQPLYATAARRRLAVAAHIVLTVAFGALVTHLYLSDALWTIAVMAVLLLPWMVATGVINGAARGLLDLRERVLDERQVADRRRVLARAHRTTTLLLVTAAVTLLTVGAINEDAPRPYAAPLLIAVLVVHWLMPVWVAGLTAKDEPAEEEEPAVQGG
ncbi:hypothetical protein [Streptomyces sp. TRM68367]|uniref:hypothetical protein n=1 Tax=Streptomyces sp. TRM68367 TaxID=2758415 RepID=UPI00165A444E|nr:hypothetical protein [Streptomyces sp. TRM68367]MBC9726314.1 hypothetical protein [Streptomyces sp. TRM68367]